MALTTQTFKASYPARDTLALFNNVLASFNTSPFVAAPGAPGLGGGFSPGSGFGGGSTTLNPVTFTGGGTSTSGGGVGA